MKRREFIQAAAGAAAGASTSAVARTATVPMTDGFDVSFERGHLTKLRASADHDQTDYLIPGLSLGGVDITLRRGTGGWVRFGAEAGAEIRYRPSAGTSGVRESILIVEGRRAARLSTGFRRESDGLVWTIHLENLLDETLFVDDLALPLPMNSGFSDKKPIDTFVLKHSFVSGGSSFLYWLRPNSAPPYLIMTPECGTGLEYWDHHEGAPYRAFIHSVAERKGIVEEEGGTWRWPPSMSAISPHGKLEHAVRFDWADGREGVRKLLARRGLLDIDIIPGMTIPRQTDVTIAIRTSQPVTLVTAEHAEQTAISRMPDRAERQLYRVRFDRLGENLLTLYQEGRGETHLEFFVTEPIETLIAKRAAFIANHQHRDPAKWYYGLLAEWNASSGMMLGPDNYDKINGWRIYAVTCDDPGLSKPAFLASKNAEFPVQEEVAALDLYIEHFVWGGLQRTTAEPYPYGIYGILDWKRNRESRDKGPKGQLHIWRPYDYPHIVCLYLGMWRIAQNYPWITTRLSARTYLERATGTAIAMFTVPLALIGWSAYETGFYNECVIPDLIEILEHEGLQAQADLLRHHWERKVDFFLHGKPNLFGSEYAFDSTGFESMQALASYALDHVGGSGPLKVADEEVRRFAKRQVEANIFCRGSIEPAYYLLGSDYRGGGGDAYTLSYMAQMGGWAIQRYALTMASDPVPLLRLGYQSFLSSWALVNSGTPDSNYGYWFPGARNDGSAGGGFEPKSHGTTWLDQPHHRGSWYYSCEIDLGFCGALRSAATIVMDDPIFGLTCLGGRMEEDGPTLVISPQDGIRRRLHLRLTDWMLDVEIENSRLAEGASVGIHRGKIDLVLAKGPPSSPQIRIACPRGRVEDYRLIAGGNEVSMPPGARTGPVSIPAVASDESMIITLEKRA